MPRTPVSQIYSPLLDTADFRSVVEFPHDVQFDLSVQREVQRDGSVVVEENCLDRIARFVRHRLLLNLSHRRNNLAGADQHR